MPSKPAEWEACGRYAGWGEKITCGMHERSHNPKTASTLRVGGSIFTASGRIGGTKIDLFYCICAQRAEYSTRSGLKARFYPLQFHNPSLLRTSKPLMQQYG